VGEQISRGRLWQLRLLSVASGTLLSILLGCVLLVAYVGHCRRTLTDVPLLPKLALARRLFHSPEYEALVGIVTRGEKDSFDTVYDYDEAVALSRERFIPTNMYGELKYRNRPDIQALEVVVWSGLQRQALSVVASPEVLDALSRCQVLAKISLDFDDHGFRKTEFARQEGEATILFVGDSFTEAAQVPSEASFVNLFGRQLRAAGLPVAPLNAGVDGYSQLEESWVVEQYAVSTGARMVIDTLFPNDVHTNYEKVIRGEGVPEKNYTAMFSSLQRMLDHCRGHGIRLVLVLMPTHEQAVDPLAGRVFQARVTAWAREHSVRVLDPLPRFRERGGAELYLSGDPHLSQAGHREYAAYLFDELGDVLKETFPPVESRRQRPKDGVQSQPTP
jgi:GDSL-like Lipase/Acylhydrolase family